MSPVRTHVVTTKRGSAPKGTLAKAPQGKFIHDRQTTRPTSDYSTCRTMIKGGKELRICKIKGSKEWEVQSILTPIKGAK